MKTMRKLYDQCMEELDGVCCYSECSLTPTAAGPITAQIRKDGVPVTGITAVEKI